MDEDKAIKERAQPKNLENMQLDDDDMPSEDEQELMNEINPQMDGNIKFSKEVGGYDEQGEDKDDSESNHLDDDLDEDLQKFIKPLRETHSKYLQYLRQIEYKKEINTASVDIAFPLDFKKVLMLTIAEDTLDKVLVRSVPNIEKCTLIKPKNENDEPYLIVQGINFDAFYPHQNIIDINRIETNHSYALKSKYGVEAMRANIVKEILMVFGVYGIAVNKRHLSLIADFMTFNGDYRAFNRIGMEESSSPFLKMSYETTMKYLVSASQTNEKDNMSAPSSAIVMG
jgi:DNA-directed RNA polymerase I subunit RPA1